MKYILFILCYVFLALQSCGQQNFDKLWLRYEPIKNEELKADYQELFKQTQYVGLYNSTKSVICNELELGFSEILNIQPEIVNKLNEPLIKYGLLVTTTKSSLADNLIGKLDYLGDEGYVLKLYKKDNKKLLVLAANTEKGLLYGTFELLKLLRLETPISKIERVNIPRNKIRAVNHWDDPAGHVERGYAGNSIFHWDDMSILTARDTMYVRSLASLGMNMSVINNVNTKTNECIGWELLKTERIDNLIPFAKLLDSYGIKMFISVNFAAPILIDSLETADPLDTQVIAWWESKAAECFNKLPGFGGFMVKADSEGEPGPIEYGRNHADGANMMAKAVAAFDGFIFWRAFVYNLPNLSDDRTKHAYENFHPLDGKFADNVIIQSKNGPVDFQVREPAAPLFGGLPNTNTALEFQITQEYTGQSTHLCFLIPMWKEVLDFDTYALGKGTAVSDIIMGKLYNYKYSGISAVWNFGDDKNWTGHYLAQANTYGFGQLAWNPNMSSKSIAEEWVKLTFGQDELVVKTITDMLLNSWKTFENYTSPLGSGMLSDIHHFDPDMKKREYVLNADDKMLGRDRTYEGTNYVAHYHEPIRSIYNDVNTTPDELLLFFHRVPYTHMLQSGETVIQHIYNTHYEGVKQVEEMILQWKSLKDKINRERYLHVLHKLHDQLKHSKVWRDHINKYFHEKSGIDDKKKRF